MAPLYAYFVLCFCEGVMGWKRSGEMNGLAQW
jgi:hypothetical protein